jgi:hypothetical protein
MLAGVAVKVPFAGSNSSAELSVRLAELPPAISTLPSPSNVALWFVRSMVIVPAVSVNDPAFGS